jgi:DNA polymerase-3 subunit gamma/tau
MEVMEVDGASNNGVEQVRTLTDTIKYNPGKDKHKVYIIDEVHMLSIAAFNALLKNLEEPPPRVVFIFATTELHKVPETIQSRCQLFTFYLIPRETIVQRLENLAERESFTCQPRVFDIIARASGGSMRDAESILEKVVTFCGRSVTEETALSALGLVSRELFFELSEAVLAERTAECFSIVERVVQEGRNLDRFIRDAVDFFRNLLFLHCAAETEDSLDMPSEEKKRMKTMAPRFREHQLLYILDTLCELETALKHSLSPKVLIEIAFVKLSHSRNVLPIDQVIRKLNEIEDRVSAGVSKEPPPAPASASSSPSRSVVSLKNIADGWNDFLKHLELRNAMFRNYLAEASPVRLNGNALVLQYPEANVFDAKTLDEPRNRDFLEKELMVFFEHPLSFQIEVSTSAALKTGGSETGKNRIKKINVKKKNDAFANKALDIFDGEVVDVNHPEKGVSQ